jgi:ABC-type uncharacterized transport system permease subunit
MNVLFILAALMYGAASFAYGLDPDAPDSASRSQVAHQTSVRQRRAHLLLALAGVLHFCTIGAQCVRGEHPFESVFLATSLGALMTVAGYCALTLARPMHALGMVLAPTGLLGLAVGVMFGATSVHDPLPAPVQSLATAHIGLATVGFAGFTLAAAVAGLYLVMERRLRQRQWKLRPGSMSLAGLERLHYQIVLLVTPVFTLAIVTGVLWTLRAGGVAGIGARWVEIGMAVAAWLASVCVLVLRAGLGIRGRKLAALTLLAFVLTLLVIVWYGVRS